MPKAFLSYDLDDLDDKHAFELASKALDYQLFAWAYKDILRHLWKHEIPDHLSTADQLIDHLHDEFIRLHKEYDLEDPL
jgi:hypothetical protein